MVHSRFLGLWALVVVLVSACSSSDGGDGNGRDIGDVASGGMSGSGGMNSSGGSSDASVPLFPRRDGGPFSGPSVGHLVRIRIEPQNAALTLVDGAAVTQDFRVFGTYEGQTAEVDITDRSVFYVAENRDLGSFDQNGPTFATNGMSPHGGFAIIAAVAANPDGSTTEGRTGLSVRVDTEFADPRDDGSATYDVPAGAETLFEGTEDADRAPNLVYPNNGALLPPNLNRLAVHFQPGNQNTLFQVRFESALLSLRYHMRCGDAVANGCMFELDDKGYEMVAETNRGSSPVTIEVLATDDSGTAFGRSAQVKVQFAQDDVNGGLYYWSTTDPTSIMRFNFGVRDAVPETFLEDGSNGIPACVGCHAISPDGRRVVASLRGQREGQQVLVNDLSIDPGAPNFLTRDGSDGNGQRDNNDRLQFASFKADGSEFVAIFGDTSDTTDRNTLWFHDGADGSRLPGREIVLPFEPDHPDWSASGDTILMTRVGIHNTSQRPYNCGIELIRNDGNDWSTPETVIPIVDGDGKTHYNPDFVTDDAFFVFSESTCPNPSNESHSECDGDSDPTATTWAALAEANATPVFLANAAAPGVMDNGETELSDTFPRGAPFRSTYLSPEQVLDVDVVRKPIYWVTVGSTRRVGLQNGSGGRQLWMFAVDPEKVLAGEDGSFPAFHLPFQDLSTDNHIGQWTRTIVTDEPPPPLPEPPPPVIPPPPSVE